jgi:intein-encoded DNA endonuclease-like protein
VIEGANTTRLNSTNSYIAIQGSATYISNSANAAGLTFADNTIASWSNDSVDFTDKIKLVNLSADPSGVAGEIYFNTTTNKFRGYNGTAWVDLG